MQDVHLQIKEAWQLNQKGDHAAALNLILETWAKNQILPDSFAYGLAFSCMRKAKKTAAAKDLYSSMPPEYRNVERAVQSFHWIVFDSLKSETSTDKLLNKADWLMTHVLQGESLLKEKTALLVANHIWKQSPVAWDSLNTWLDSIQNPDQLSKEPFVIEFKGKEKRLASEFETWHYRKAKTLFMLGHYRESIKISEQIMSRKDFHSVYGLFFSRLAAQAYGKIGDHHLKLQMLQRDGDQSWFTLFDISQTYLTLKDPDQALYFALDAIISKGQEEHKIHLYKFAADLLHNLAIAPDVQKGLYQAYLMCRKKLGTIKPDPAIQQLVEQYQIESEPSFDITKIRTVSSMCKNLLEQTRQRQYRGVITRLFPARRIGFVKFDSFQYTVKDKHLDSAIFYLDEVGQPIANALQEGQTIEFDLKPAFDQKKQQISCVAIRVSRESN